jgi:hypothetical protein
MAQKARFRSLEYQKNYDIIDGKTGYWRTQGIQGANAMTQFWNKGDEAWPSGTTEFENEQPIEIAK